MLKRLLLAIAATLPGIFQHACAQQNYFFSNYTVDDGLSDLSVHAIVKDREGFLWAGTYAGLNKFNGYDFVMYKSIGSDSTSLPSNYINHLLVDHTGQMWISTSGGICVYEKKKDCFRRMAFKKSARNIMTVFENLVVFEDSKKNIWAGTIGEGLLRYDAGEDCFVSALPETVASRGKFITSVSEEADGTLWITAHACLLHFDPVMKKAEVYENRILSKDRFQDMVLFNDTADKNYLWIGTWGNGLVQFNKHTGQFVDYKFESNAPANLGNIIFGIESRDKNTLWLATNPGILAFDLAEKKYKGFIRDSLHEKNVVNREAYIIYTDDERISWIGTSAGLCNINPVKQNFTAHPLWLNNGVSRIFVDEDAGKYYGVRIFTKRSLTIYDSRLTTINTYSIPGADQLRAEPFALLKDRQGLIWVGTTHGLYTFSEAEKKFRLFNISQLRGFHDHDLYIQDLLEDHNGNIWMAWRSKGLLEYERSTGLLKTYFSNPADPESFPCFAIMGIVESDDHAIYAIDEYHGIVKLDPVTGAFENLNPTQKKYSSLESCTDMAFDKEQRLWVTTKNNGLVCIDKNKKVTVRLKDDFGNLIDQQQRIVIDKTGKVWLTASNGIYCFNPQTESFTHFTAQDGFPVRSIDEPLILMKDGSIAFNYYKGLFRFSPGKPELPQKPVRVHLVSLAVNGKVFPFSSSIDYMDTIRLNHNENNLSVEFAATNFNNPASTLYSYRLDGADKNWSAGSRSRNVNFSQLSPGNYHLRIRAGEQGPEKQMVIQVIPAWWQTILFRLLAAALIVTLIFYSIRFFYSLRYQQKLEALERQREIEQIRFRISRDIHDEIGSGLTKIKLMSRNLLRKEKEEESWKEATSRITTASDELIQNLGEIVWTINPANDTLENIFAFVRNYVSKLFDENPDIQLHLDFTEPGKIPQGIIIDPEVKRNLLLILKESLTNIFRHSRATIVTVSLHAGQSKIKMSIRDNGIGMHSIPHGGKQEAVSGNGINNMRRRAELVNAVFQFQLNGNGASVELSIPIDTERKIPT